MRKRDPMRRMRVYIPLQMHRELAQLAERRGVPMAELIREAVESFIRQHSRPTQRDPALDIIGLVRSSDGPRDVSDPSVQPTSCPRTISNLYTVANANFAER